MLGGLALVAVRATSNIAQTAAAKSFSPVERQSQFGSPVVSDDWQLKPAAMLSFAAITPNAFGNLSELFGPCA
ncbi:hypothetical protein NKJ26_20385 [Mesorhizobium sp. M0152]|uniref:hypothetical protein n=1 Tax=Mesorhizobium sp. M0152 TaxID=2956898 RepID=UPI003337A908